ncbi:hypothetical protein X797_011564 [Metarhizium robertsii]|uniref:Uncharacterized protein n=1 Tax=Metarhizium robertsii TaxID=568076 RepID=A0A014QRG6_9HYPO|nr:hypothetical protein X797_011564 [Metarhizium robertsii]
MPPNSLHSSLRPKQYATAIGGNWEINSTTLRGTCYIYILSLPEYTKETVMVVDFPRIISVQKYESPDIMSGCSSIMVQ